MKPAERWNGEVAVDLLGCEVVLRPTFKAVEEIERRTGDTIIAIAGRLRDGMPRSSDIVHILVACADAGGSRNRITGRAFTGDEIAGAIYGDERDDAAVAWVDVASALVVHYLTGGRIGRAAVGEASAAATSGLVRAVDGRRLSSASSGPATGPLPS